MLSCSILVEENEKKRNRKQQIGWFIWIWNLVHSYVHGVCMRWLIFSSLLVSVLLAVIYFHFMSSRWDVVVVAALVIYVVGLSHHGMAHNNWKIVSRLYACIHRHRHTHITKLLTRVHYTLHINAEMECWPPLCELIALSHTHTHSTCSSSFFVIFIQTKSMTTVPSVSLPSSSHSCPGVWTVSFHSLLYTNVKIVFHTMQSLHSITSYFHHYVLQLVPD